MSINFVISYSFEKKKKIVVSKENETILLKMIKILLLFTLFHFMIVNLEIAKIEHPIFHTLMISPSFNLLILLHFISFAFLTVLLGGTQSYYIYSTASLLIVMCLVLLSCILCARMHGRIFHFLIFTAFEIRNSIKVVKQIFLFENSYFFMRFFMCSLS